MLIDVVSECRCVCSSEYNHDSGAVSDQHSGLLFGMGWQEPSWNVGVLLSHKDTGFRAHVCFLGASKDFMSTPVASVVIARSGTGHAHMCP